MLNKIILIPSLFIEPLAGLSGNQGHQTRPHIYGLSNVYMFIKFEDDTNYSLI